MARVRNILEHKGTEVVTCGPGDTALHAAHLMNDHGIGAVVVVDGGRVVGIFSERDLMRRVVAAERDPATSVLRDVMTSPVITGTAEMLIDECRAIITARRIRHLPIAESGTLHGIVTSGDVLAHHLREQQEALDYLNSWAQDGR